MSGGPLKYAKISFAELFTNTGRLQLICLWRQTFLRFSVRAEIYDLSRDQPRIGPYRPRAGGIWGVRAHKPSTIASQAISAGKISCNQAPARQISTKYFQHHQYFRSSQSKNSSAHIFNSFLPKAQDFIDNSYKIAHHHLKGAQILSNFSNPRAYTIKYQK